MSEKHGLDAEIAIKMDAKYSVERESEAIAWIEEITGLQVGNDFLGGLKTGVVLCTLMNKISPGSISKFAAKPKHYLEHKVFFLNSCKLYKRVRFLFSFFFCLIFLLYDDIIWLETAISFISCHSLIFFLGQYWFLYWSVYQTWSSFSRYDNFFRFEWFETR